MGMIRGLFLSALLYLCFLSAMQAQESRTVGGRKFIVHTVEAGQTLYAISRSYALPAEELLRANPDAQAGLSIGQELLIPEDAIVRKEARTAPILLRDGELQHTVAKRETLFGIARNYGVDVNALLARNPEASSGLREGMIVVVPMGHVSGQKESVIRPAQPAMGVDHTIQPGETLFGLGKRYSVDPESIKAANGGLPEGLKAGDVVRIPVPTGTVPKPAELVSTARKSESYKIALLLPFSLDKNDSVRAASSGDRDRFYESTRIAAQFNAGAMLALDSLKALGFNGEVLVVDMGEDERTWTKVLARTDLKDVDLFIGPFHRSAIEQVARAFPTVHIVCPVPQSNKVILGFPTVSKVTATRVDLIKQTARYMAKRHGKDNILLLKPDIHADKEAVDQMQRALNSALGSTPGNARDSVKVVPTGRRDVGKLVASLVADRLNVLVVPSEDVEYVTAFVAAVRPLASKYSIAVVGLESWQTIATVSANDLETLGFIFASATYYDVDDARTQKFILEFRERYKNEVDEYAFMGHDVMLFYGKALLGYGTAFPEHLTYLGGNTLNMLIQMSRTGPENGFRNEGAIMLRQKDLKLERVN